MSVESFGKYDFGIDYGSIGEHDAYIVNTDDAGLFVEYGYATKYFGNYAVCYDKEK